MAKDVASASDIQGRPPASTVSTTTASAASATAAICALLSFSPRNTAAIAIDISGLM